MKIILALVLLLFVPLAKADSIVSFSTSATFTALNMSENFDTSFLWDVQTQSVVPNSMQVTTSGDFGTAFAFAGSLDAFTPSSDSHSFEWDNSSGGVIRLWETDIYSGIEHMIPGLTLSDSTLPSPLVASGWNTGPIGQFGTPVPEPSSLLLLGFGLLSITLISSKLLRHQGSD